VGVFSAAVWQHKNWMAISEYRAERAQEDLSVSDNASPDLWITKSGRNDTPILIEFKQSFPKIENARNSLGKGVSNAILDVERIEGHETEVRVGAAFVAPYYRCEETCSDEMFNKLDKNLNKQKALIERDKYDFLAYTFMKYPFPRKEKCPINGDNEFYPGVILAGRLLK
jgi:hypothetical protein